MTEPFGGHPLAHRDGITLICLLIQLQGGACDQCGYGTRVTSKNWARCKKCGHRVRRRSVDEVREIMKAGGEGA